LRGELLVRADGAKIRHNPQDAFGLLRRCILLRRSLPRGIGLRALTTRSSRILNPGSGARIFSGLLRSQSRPLAEYNKRGQQNAAENEADMDWPPWKEKITEGKLPGGERS